MAALDFSFLCLVLALDTVSAEPVGRQPNSDRHRLDGDYGNDEVTSTIPQSRLVQRKYDDDYFGRLQDYYGMLRPENQDCAQNHHHDNVGNVLIGAGDISLTLIHVGAPKPDLMPIMTVYYPPATMTVPMGQEGQVLVPVLEQQGQTVPVGQEGQVLVPVFEQQGQTVPVGQEGQVLVPVLEQQGQTVPVGQEGQVLVPVLEHQGHGHFVDQIGGQTVFVSEDQHQQMVFQQEVDTIGQPTPSTVLGQYFAVGHIPEGQAIFVPATVPRGQQVVMLKEGDGGDRPVPGLEGDWRRN